jgi:V/A-type H+/Na+-transporting ATPase subunit K
MPAWLTGLVVTGMTAAVTYFALRHRRHGMHFLIGFNCVLTVAATALLTTALTPAGPASEALLWAAVAVAGSTAGAGIAITHAGAAPAAAISGRPGLFGRAMAIAGLAEGIAIYGLIAGIILIGGA